MAINGESGPQCLQRGRQHGMSYESENRKEKPSMADPGLAWWPGCFEVGPVGGNPCPPGWLRGTAIFAGDVVSASEWVGYRRLPQRHRREAGAGEFHDGEDECLGPDERFRLAGADYPGARPIFDGHG